MIFKDTNIHILLSKLIRKRKKEKTEITQTLMAHSSTKLYFKENKI